MLAYVCSLVKEYNTGSWHRRHGPRAGPRLGPTARDIERATDGGRVWVDAMAATLAGLDERCS